MKNCPKCHVDFSDDFSFCEFDGTGLTKVFEEKKRYALFSRLYEQRRFVQIIGVAFFICIIAFFILAKNNRRKTDIAVNQTSSTSVEPASFYVETPQSARDYLEEEADEKAQKENKDKAPEKPGVEVFLPDAKQTKEPQPVAKSPTKEKSEPTEPESEPVNRSVRNQPVNTPPPANSQPPTSQPASSRSPRAQIATNQRIEDDDPVKQSANSNSSVSLNLVRIRSYRTDSGVRYDLTFNMQQQEGRVIRWERLNLSTRSSSGITHSEVVPFYQRLGSSGSLNFTVSVEMRGRAEADFQGRITCTGTGTDVEGRSIKTDFTARVNP
jgi:outer membrane biosynthesis protein TonB